LYLRRKKIGVFIALALVLQIYPLKKVINMKISDDIHNYYEKLVSQHFTALKLEDNYDAEFIADLVCVVLNQLPTRHEVDMAFYLPASERFEMENNVKVAVSKALEFMKEHN
jgi:hypothetical protein